MSHSRSSTRRTLAVGLVAVATMVALSGCGSKSSAAPTAGSTGGASAAGVDSAKNAVADKATMPTKIPITAALSKTPPTGKKVVFITPAQGDYQRWTAGFTEAAKALGWSPTVSTFAANPADANGMVEQAIRQGADYIAVGAAVFPTNDPMVAAAKAAKVPLFYYSTDVEPKGEANWAFSAIGATKEYVARGTLAADQVVAAAHGHAKTLLFNVPQFLVFQTYAKAFTEEYNKVCPGCSLEKIDAPIGDVLSGKSGSAVVAFLRSHPDINELNCNTSNFCQDIPAKAKAAGITIGKGGIGFTMGGTGDAQVPWFGDGTAISGQANPYEYSGWQLVDAMARYSVGDSIEPNWAAALPIYVYDTENAPAGTAPYQGPTDYKAQFKALWGM